MPAQLFQFGDFRLDSGRFELLRDGLPLRLERKPLELLLLLVRAQGNLVSRSQIAQHLWESEVFVDTEHGINTAIRKIRLALRDDPENPRFIQTVPGMGYRFIAPIVATPATPTEIPPASQPSDPPLVELEPSPETVAPSPKSSAGRSPRGLLLSLAAVALLVVATLALTLGPHPVAARLLHPNQPAIASIAVLPLDNLSGDPNQNYFADGMTDELITQLARDSTLRITSRTSVMQYKDAHRPLSEIARALNVDAIVEGSVNRNGNHVHMTLQLIRADTDSHIWANSYDRGNEDSTTLPDEAARAIAARLQRTAASLSPVHPVNPEAHDDYLRGHYLWNVGRNNEAGPYYRKAVELQPDYAAGWAGLSEHLNVEAMYTGNDPSQDMATAEAAAHKAVELDDSLAHGHIVLGAALLFSHWDALGALKEVDRAIELDPESGQAYHLKAKILCALNRFDEANTAQAQSTAANPFEHPGARAEIFNCTRRFKEAIQDGQLRLRDFPTSADLLGPLSAAYLGNGQEKEAAEMLIRQFNAEGNLQFGKAAQAAFAKRGFRGILETELTFFEGWHVNPVDLARLHARLGHRDTAIHLLNRALDQHAPLLAFRLNNPDFDSLHNDPRFRAIAQKVGLPYQVPGPSHSPSNN